LHNLTKDREAELIAELNQQKNVFWLSSLRGRYDLVVSIHVKNVIEFTKKYEKLFKNWKDYILDRNVILLEKARSYTRSHLLSKKESQEMKYGDDNEEIKYLDATDIKILQILNREGRIALIDMAKRVKVSADTINYRIKRMKQQGIITGFGLKIDYDKINYNYAILLLKMQNMNLDKYEKMNTFCRMNSNIVIQIKTIGNHDFELEIEYASKEELDLLMKSLRDNFVNEIKDYEILEVTREHMITYFPF
jgi:DNA-binding Lrp family transcriptional regulator